MNFLHGHIKTITHYLGVAEHHFIHSEYQEFHDDRHKKSRTDAMANTIVLAQSLARLNDRSIFMSTAALQKSVNPVAVEASETFQNTWPYRARYSRAPGFAMHYVDEGKGETLLFLHGEPTWGYLFRHQIAVLKEHYRVVAPDHMGFGKSETPDDRTYFLQDHIDNLEAFVLDLDLRDITLVMHDFGGPTGMGLAIRHPDRIKRVISVNGPTPLGQPDLIDRLTANVVVSPWFQWILKAEEQGTLEKSWAKVITTS